VRLVRCEVEPVPRVEAPMAYGGKPWPTALERKEKVPAAAPSTKVTSWGGDVVSSRRAPITDFSAVLREDSRSKNRTNGCLHPDIPRHPPTWMLACLNWRWIPGPS
jgi:hypothetical protein